MASSSLSSLVAKAQSIKAQSLATLMSTLGAVQGVSAVAGNQADNPHASLQSAEAAVKATVIAVDDEGRAILDLDGTRVEARLPQEVLNAAAKSGEGLRPGTQIRLPPDMPARLLAETPTRVQLHGQAQGASLGPPAPLASPFPPGSLGAAIARLAGIALPGAEAEVTAPSPGTPSPGATSPGVTSPGALPPPAAAATLRPGMIAHVLQPEILTALVQAAGRQLPLAQGLHCLLSLPPDALETLPQAVPGLIRALAQQRSRPEALGSPEALAKAVANSGVFLEAHLAAGAGPPQGDLKALLLNLKSLLGDGGVAPPAPGAGGMANAAALFLGEEELPPAATRNAMEGKILVPGETAPGEATRMLARAVDGALERIKLSQLASLPDHPEIRVTDDRVQPLRLAVSLPLAPQGQERAATAVLGLVFEHRPGIDKPPAYDREDEAGSAETAGFPWKVHIALDLEETGPVQAEIALRGQAIGVTFWAERSNMADAARQEIGALHRALTQAAFDVVNLEVKNGLPHLRRLHQEPLLDRRT